MKNVLSLLTILFLVCFASAAFAQVKKETIKVSGECGMCKKHIESAAKQAGASTASWNVDTKVLTVRYDAKASSTAKIQQSVAAAGYDSPGYRASDAAYKKLDACCQYERAGAVPASCCDSDKCTKTACMKDGKCAPGMSCCKEAGCSEKDCCKKDERHASAASQKGCCATAAACCAPKAACCAKP